MRDVTDQGLAWLASALPEAHGWAAAWDRAPREGREIPAGAVFDAVGTPVERACGLLERLVSYELTNLPVAISQGLMWVLAKPTSATPLKGLTFRDPAGRVLDVVLLGQGDLFPAPPLTHGGGPDLWLVAPTSRPDLPGASVILAALAAATEAPGPPADPVLERLRAPAALAGAAP
jgi:hypothetical protein